MWEGVTKKMCAESPFNLTGLQLPLNLTKLDGCRCYLTFVHH